MPMSPAEFGKLVADETEKWAKVVRLRSATWSISISMVAVVAAYRAALEERTRERVPLDWAVSTGNQGVAMRGHEKGYDNVLYHILIRFPKWPAVLPSRLPNRRF
jgi:hypothetical protein